MSRKPELVLLQQEQLGEEKDNRNGQLKKVAVVVKQLAFKMCVALRHRAAVTRDAKLELTLCYDAPNYPPLTSLRGDKFSYEQERVEKSGSAEFSLAVRLNVLSSQHEKSFFVLRVQALGPDSRPLADLAPLHSKAMRVVSKLCQVNAPPRGQRKRKQPLNETVIKDLADIKEQLRLQNEAMRLLLTGGANLNSGGGGGGGEDADASAMPAAARLPLRSESADKPLLGTRRRRHAHAQQLSSSSSTSSQQQTEEDSLQEDSLREDSLLSSSSSGGGGGGSSKKRSRSNNSERSVPMMMPPALSNDQPLSALPAALPVLSASGCGGSVAAQEQVITETATQRIVEGMRTVINALQLIPEHRRDRALLTVTEQLDSESQSPEFATMLGLISAEHSVCAADDGQCAAAPSLALAPPLALATQLSDVHDAATSASHYLPLSNSDLLGLPAGSGKFALSSSEDAYNSMIM